ncbi:MAG: hypothetical protein KAW90_08015 [Dehalococcoidales bacterium]|nr:hypothetical protein [Dehalococcoidales bacterium]
MLVFFTIMALIFLIAGGIGLFYTNVNLGSGSALWVFGNITFGVFTIVGIALIIFLALFNTEFD